MLIQLIAKIIIFMQSSFAKLTCKLAIFFKFCNISIFSTKAKGKAAAAYHQNDETMSNFQVPDEVTIDSVEKLDKDQMAGPSREKTSWVWDHFEEAPADGRKAKCNYCDNDLRKRTEIMRKHLRSKHKEQLKAKESQAGLVGIVKLCH
jgi:hypothetical protein